MKNAASFHQLLDGYARGVLCSEASLLVATVMAINQKMRQHVAHYEAAAGKSIESESPTQVHCLEKVLQNIGTCCPAPLSPTPRLPAPLSKLLTGCTEDRNACWRPLYPGIEYIPLDSCDKKNDAARLFLLRFAPHAVSPCHQHPGIEITLVLQGEYHDEQDFYQTGDISFVTPDDTPHTPKAGEKGCLCLILQQIPPIPKTRRIVTAFFQFLYIRR